MKFIIRKINTMNLIVRIILIIFFFLCFLNANNFPELKLSMAKDTLKVFNKLKGGRK